jgi:hypothetical protein
MRQSHGDFTRGLKNSGADGVADDYREPKAQPEHAQQSIAPLSVNGISHSLKNSKKILDKLLVR